MIFREEAPTAEVNVRASSLQVVFKAMGEFTEDETGVGEWRAVTEPELSMRLGAPGTEKQGQWRRTRG